MIVKDEIDHLEGCLDSVAELVDEIAILDTGSTDGTWPLVQLRAHRSAQIDWPNHFAQARNQSLDLAGGDWILVLDADERLIGGLGAIQKAIRDPDLLAAEIRMQNDLGDGRTADFWALRLFRRFPDIRFQGRIHEQVVRSCEDRRDREAHWKIRRVDCTVLHLGYEPSLFKKRGKAERNVALLEQALDELQPGAPIEKRVYLEYKLGAALGQGAAGQVHILRAASRLLQAGTDAQDRFSLTAELFVRASQTWRQGGSPEVALEAADAAIRLAPDHPMVHLVQGQALLGLGRNADASSALARSRAGTGEEPAFFFDPAGHEVALSVAEATVFQRQGDPDSAKAALEAMRQCHPDNAQAQLAWVHGLIQLEDATAALRAGLDYLKAHPGDRGGLLACASAAEALGMQERADRWRSKALG